MYLEEPRLQEYTFSLHTSVWWKLKIETHAKAIYETYETCSGSESEKKIKGIAITAMQKSLTCSPFLHATSTYYPMLFTLNPHGHLLRIADTGAFLITMPTLIMPMWAFAEKDCVFSPTSSRQVGASMQEPAAPNVPCQPTAAHAWCFLFFVFILSCNITRSFSEASSRWPSLSPTLVADATLPLWNSTLLCIAASARRYKKKRSSSVGSSHSQRSSRTPATHKIELRAACRAWWSRMHNGMQCKHDNCNFNIKTTPLK